MHKLRRISAICMAAALLAGGLPVVQADAAQAGSALKCVDFRSSSDVKQAKKIKKYTVVEGGTVLIEDTELFIKFRSVKVSDEEGIEAIVKPEPNIKKIYSYADDSYNGVYVKGKKAGSYKVTVRPSKKEKYVYKVKVLSAEETEQKALNALDEYIAGLDSTVDYKPCYFDFNGDGISDMLAGNKIYAYQYDTGKVVSVKTGLKRDRFRDIYISKDNHIAYIGVEPDLSKKKKGESAPYVVAGRYFVFDLSVPFGVRSEVELYALFDKEDKIAGYCYHDSSYDQDDLWYDAFTYEDWQAKLQETGFERVPPAFGEQY